jgi:hypothetical protein
MEKSKAKIHYSKTANGEIKIEKLEGFLTEEKSNKYMVMKFTVFGEKKIKKCIKA